MNILILSPFFPYPLNSGGKIRVFNIIKYLSKKHRVTLACLSAGKTEDFGPLKEICDEVVCVERRQNLAKDLTVFLFGSEPFNYVRYSSSDLTSALHGLLQRKAFDIVQIEFSMMWQYAGIFKGIPVVLDAHNIEYEIIRQIKDTCGNPIKKILYSLEEKKLRYKEEEAWKECNLCLAVSDKERDVIASFLDSRDRVVTIPNGVDLSRFEFMPKESTDKRLLFIGGMDYTPNLDSALYLLNDILPTIKSKVPDIKLDVVGRELWRIPGRESFKGVEFHEDVPDVLPYFRKADILLVPLRYGAGTRVKIVEGMAAGVPIVSTSKGCEGTYVKHAEHILIADSPDEFASSVQRLLDNAELRRSITLNARRLVEERYSWERLVREMSEFWGHL